MPPADMVVPAVALGIAFLAAFFLGCWKGDRDARADASRVVCKSAALGPDDKAEISKRILSGPEHEEDWT